MDRDFNDGILELDITLDPAYQPLLAQATGIKADVYFEWVDKPADGDASARMRLRLNSEKTGWVDSVEMPAGTPTLTQGQWATVVFPLNEALGTSAWGNMQLKLAASKSGTYGGHIILRVDNIQVTGVSNVGPARPTGLAGVSGTGGPALTWDAPPDALTYTVYRRAKAYDLLVPIATGLTSPAYTDHDTTLRGDRPYYYRVTATNAQGEGSTSTELAVSTLPDYAALTSFETDLAPWAAQGDGTTAAISTTIVNDGAQSAEISITTPGYKPFFTTPVSNYRNIIAQAKGITADVYIEWIDRPSGTGGTYQGIQLFREHSGQWGGSDAAIGNIEFGQWRTLTWDLEPAQIAAMTSFDNRYYSNIGFLINVGTWGGATFGGTIKVRIDNVRVTGFSAMVVPPAPTGLTATALTETDTNGKYQIALAWGASSTAWQYTVQRSSTSGGGFYNIAGLGTATSYTDQGLDPATTYYYRIVPVNAGGDGDASVEVSATTEGVAPAGIATWRQTHFGTSEATGNAANDADPDADGVANLLEYALAGDPMVAENDLLPVTAVEADHLKLSFDSIDDPALTYEVLASDDLTTWSPIWTSETNVLGLVTVTDPEPLSAHPRRFLRLRVTTP